MTLLKPWAQLLLAAQAEVQACVTRLPPEVREVLATVPVVWERRPSRALQQDGIEPDTLGLFVGETMADIGQTGEPLPPQIILFLENIADQAEEIGAAFETEVRTTFLHEAGHFLGWDEDDLTARGLD